MYIGIDIGGTKIRGGLLDSKFRVQKIIEQPTEAEKPAKAVINNIYKVISQLNSPQVKGIGMASRGLIDYKEGVVMSVDKMPKDFSGTALAKLVKAKFKKQTFLDNDVNCFTLAEGTIGVGKGLPIVVGVTLGTGIGGGILVDGKVYRGASGGAAEFGKTIINIDWFIESKGQWGKFEDLASGTGMDNLYKLKTGKQVGSKEVEFSMYRGNKKAEDVIKKMSHYVAAGLANIIQSINPHMIIMGGGVGKVRALVDPAIKLIPKYVMYKELAGTPIRYAELGPHAGLMGAAMLLKEAKK